MKYVRLIPLISIFIVVGANAQVVGGFDQRYQANDYDAGAGIWADSVSRTQNATANGTFGLTETDNGSMAVVNAGDGVDMAFRRDHVLNARGFTIQMVIRIDQATGDNRQGPYALDQDGEWGGLYAGALASGEVTARAGNQGGRGGEDTVLLGNTTPRMPVGTWGVYTLVAEANAPDQLTVTFASLSDGSTLFGLADSHPGNTDDILALSTKGRLFGGEFGAKESVAWKGAIADVVVYDFVLNDTQLATNQAAFMGKYKGIPEPSAYALIGGMLAFGIVAVRRRRHTALRQ